MREDTLLWSTTIRKASFTTRMFEGKLTARIAAMLLFGTCGVLTQAAPHPFFQRGVNFTAEWPVGYDPARAAKILGQLPRYGINAIALVPYGFERKNSPDVHFGGGWEREDLIRNLTAMAHRKGMKVFLKPQIWYQEGFPGDIDFHSEADRARWFSGYRRFILHWADEAAAAHSDLFAVGVEFVCLSRYESEWRRIIAEARKHYHGPLTYAANSGPDFEDARFWDALDYIGLNEYYPLPGNLSFSAVLRTVETVQKRYHRPVIFPEAGFASIAGSHHHPWDETPTKLSLDEQARCYDTLLKAFYKKPWFQGVYWWKVGTNGFGGPNDSSLTPWGKPAMQIVANWYRNGGR